MRTVASVQFVEDGSMVVVYMDAARDVRNRELLVMSHQLHIMPGRPGGHDYEDEIEDVRDAVKKLLNDALEDFEAPVHPSDPSYRDPAPTSVGSGELTS